MNEQELVKQLASLNKWHRWIVGTVVNILYFLDHLGDFFNGPTGGANA